MGGTETLGEWGVGPRWGYADKPIVSGKFQGTRRSPWIGEGRGSIILGTHVPLKDSGCWRRSQGWCLTSAPPTGPGGHARRLVPEAGDRHVGPPAGAGELRTPSGSPPSAAPCSLPCLPTLGLWCMTFLSSPTLAWPSQFLCYRVLVLICEAGAHKL